MRQGRSLSVGTRKKQRESASPRNKIATPHDTPIHEVTTIGSRKYLARECPIASSASSARKGKSFSILSNLGGNNSKTRGQMCIEMKQVSNFETV